MKKEIIFAAAALAVGIAGGFFLGITYSKKKTVSETVEEPKEENTENVEEDLSDPLAEKVAYSDAIRDLEYRSSSDEEEISDEEVGELENYHDNQAADEYRKENLGKIEIISRKEWEKHLYQEFSDIDYSADDLYYFPDTDWLTDEFGGVLEPQEKYAGNCLIKFDFKGNDEEELYVRNHPMETDFSIHKIIGQSRDEYFEN